MKKQVIITIAAVTVTILLVVGIFVYSNISKNNDPMPHSPDTTSSVTESTESVSETEPEPKEPFVSKKDFAALKEQYPHIYAWIEVPGTNIDYPIIMHPEDDTYYLRRDAEGNYSINGCIFSEHRYNADDFTDPITLLYGHYVYEYDGYKFFGGLQSMYKDELDTYSEIVIYHPDKELHYEVFAAVRYNTYHILHGADYTKAENFDHFINGIMSINGTDSVINKEYDVKAGDRIIVLSTCYNGNPDRRFLVVAKLVEEIN